MDSRRLTEGVVLGNSPIGPLVAAPWAGSLIGLGARLARSAAHLDGSQLVVAITVPVRDLAAVLIACGWMLTQASNAPSNPVDVVATLARNTPVRMVTDQQIIAHRFFDVVPGPSGPRIHVGSSFWPLDRIHYVIAVPDLPERRFGRRDIALPGSLARKAGQLSSWIVRQCAPNADLAILGTKSWLAEDMAVCVGWGDVSLADEIGGILLPDTDNAPTWATRIYAAQLIDELALPADLRLAVLDGASAIRWLPAVESDVVVAVIDRRAVDDSAAETVMQVRARSEQLVSMDVLGWKPSAGIEALAFKVAL